MPYVGWVCRWISFLPREVFLRVLRFSPLLRNQRFQIPVRPGMVDKESISGWATSKSLFIYYLFVSLKSPPLGCLEVLFFLRIQDSLWWTQHMTVWAQVQLLQTWNVQPARKVDKQLALYCECSVIERKVLDKFVHRARLIGQMDRSHAIKIFFIKGLQQDRPRNTSSRTK